MCSSSAELTALLSKHGPVHARRLMADPWSRGYAKSQLKISLMRGRCLFITVRMTRLIGGEQVDSMMFGLVGTVT